MPADDDQELDGPLPLRVKNARVPLTGAAPVRPEQSPHAHADMPAIPGDPRFPIDATTQFVGPRAHGQSVEPMRSVASQPPGSSEITQQIAPIRRGDYVAADRFGSQFPASSQFDSNRFVPALRSPVSNAYAHAGLPPHDSVPGDLASPLQAVAPDTNRAIEGFSHSALRRSHRPVSQRSWRRWIYAVTRINLGPSRDEIYEMVLRAKVRRNAVDSYQIGVVGLKGGVGRTAVTLALGSMLSRVRGDRVLAIDADPAGGNLADRAGRQSGAVVTDLLEANELSRYNDIRAYTSMNSANLEVLSSDDYSKTDREFDETDWTRVINLVSRYYNLLLADCGAGLFSSASRGVLSSVSSLVIVGSASIDGVRQAALTMDWLRHNGYSELLGHTFVVINRATRGKPNVDIEDVVRQFERHLPQGRVIVLPWDKHIANGTEVDFDLLDKTFRRRILELAAAVSDDFDVQDRP